MFKIFHANRTERLVEQLVRQIEAQRKLPGLGVFAPAHVIVPDPAVEPYIQMELARHTGLAANLRCWEWPEFLEHILRARSPKARLADMRAMRGMLLEAIWEALEGDDPELGPVRRYVGDGAGADEEDVRERLVFGLANTLATLLHDYAWTRPAMVEAWRAGELVLQDTTGAALEVWQRRLWQLAFEGPDSVRGRLEQARGERWWLVHEVAGAVDAGQVSCSPIIHIFAPNAHGHVTYNILAALSRRIVLWGYVLNPCREFWEEMRFGRPEEEQLLLSSKGVADGQLVYGGDDSFWSDDAPLLLRFWGWSGAMHLRSLHAIEGVEDEELFDEPDAPGADGEASRVGLLGHIQRDMLAMRRPSTPPFVRRRDASLRVMAAPTIKREVEVVANEIWALMRQSKRRAVRGEPPLRFCDILLLVPETEQETYQTYIRAVFPDTWDIPFNMIDMSARSWSRAVEAVELLFNMPFGQFRRQELLRLLTHPNVMARFPSLDPEDWLRWCDELKILHGADRRDHADTYIEGELFHWDQGLRRLALGALMTGRLAEDRRVYEAGKLRYLPYELGQEEVGSAARLILMARSLIADARSCRGARMKLSEWADFLCRMIAVYLAPFGEDDVLMLHRCRQQVARLADLDFGLAQRAVSYRTAVAIALDLLRELKVRRGQFLLDGVSVATLKVGRPLPARVVCVMGLGERGFPQAEARRPEDLRGALDRSGQPVMPTGQPPDVSLRDRHKWLFLETFMSARECLILSYVSRDVKTGESLSPSSVIAELLWAVGEDYAARRGEETEAERAARVEAALVVKHELRRFHGSYFPEEGQPAPQVTPSAQPDAEREAAARGLRAELVAHCREHGVPFPDLEVLRHAFQGPAWEQLRRGLGMLPVPRESVDGAWSAERGVLRVSMSDIRNFLECPLQGSARFLLRLGEDDMEDILGQESELFEANQVASARLLQSVFLEKLALEHRDEQPYDFGPIYDQRARWYELQGLLPTGPFYSATRARHIKVLTTWQENLPLLGYGRSPRLAIRRLGRAVEHELVDVPGRPLALDVDVPVPGVGGQREVVRVEIGGRTEVLLPESDTALICHTTQQAHMLSPKYMLRGFLDHVFLAALGESTPHRWTVLINPAEEALQFKHKNLICRFKAVERNIAIDYLKDIIREMITRVHGYYLPVEVAFEHLERGEPLEVVAERRRANTWDKTSADFGPVREPRRFAPPDDAEAILQRRYGLYFEHLLRKGK